MFDDPIVGVRHRFPTGPTLAETAIAPAVAPFAARYGVDPEVIVAKHGRPPTRTSVCQPTQRSGDGNATPPTPDDTVIPAID